MYDFNQESLCLPAFALSGRLELPTADRARGVDTAVGLVFSKTLGSANFMPRLHFNTLWLHNAGADADERENGYRLIAGYTMRIGADTVGIVDYVHEREVGERRTSNLIELGLRRQITPRFVLSVGGGAGLTSDSPDARGEPPRLHSCGGDVGSRPDMLAVARTCRALTKVLLSSGLLCVLLLAQTDLAQPALLVCTMGDGSQAVGSSPAATSGCQPCCSARSCCLFSKSAKEAPSKPGPPGTERPRPLDHLLSAPQPVPVSTFDFLSPPRAFEVLAATGATRLASRPLPARGAVSCIWLI